MYSCKAKRIILTSFIVYIIVNTVENLIHYNIGKSSDKKQQFDLPSNKDWVKIVIVMIIFALLQGILTLKLNS